MGIQSALFFGCAIVHPRQRLRHVDVGSAAVERADPGPLLAQGLYRFQGSLVQRGLLLDASILSQFRRAQMRQFPPRRRLLTSALVRSLAHGDLFDHLDNAAPKLGIADARERPGQRQALRGREKIGNVSR